METDKVDKQRLIALIIKKRVKIRLDGFRDYTQELETKFEHDKEILVKSYENSTKELDDGESDLLNDLFSDNYFMIEEIYIGIYRKSTIVSLYSYLEHTMNFLCNYIHEANNYPVSLVDLRGEGIIRARNYLDKLANINFLSLNGEWCHLMSLNKIRNCIVHCEGDLEASTKTEQLRNIVNGSKFLSLENDRYLKIMKGCVEFYIEKVEEFINKLYNQIFNFK
ncbi:hypothetical protein D4R71_01015 [bacterium]|nr:MAG: hypothetical protein D4R71_01015 [bacterium]